MFVPIITKDFVDGVFFQPVILPFLWFTHQYEISVTHSRSQDVCTLKPTTRNIVSKQTEITVKHVMVIKQKVTSYSLFNAWISPLSMNLCFTAKERSEKPDVAMWSLENAARKCMIYPVREFLMLLVILNTLYPRLLCLLYLCWTCERCFGLCVGPDSQVWPHILPAKLSRPVAVVNDFEIIYFQKKWK